MLRYVAQIDTEDRVAARRLHLRFSPPLRFALWLAALSLFAFLVATLVFRDAHSAPHPLLPALVALLLFLAAWYFILLPRQIRRAYHQPFVAAAPTLSGELTDDGLTVTSEAVSGKLAWRDVLRWKHNDRLILLYSSTSDFIMIPLRGFDSFETRAAALAFLQRHLGPAER